MRVVDAEPTGGAVRKGEDVADEVEARAGVEAPEEGADGKVGYSGVEGAGGGARLCEAVSRVSELVFLQGLVRGAAHVLDFELVGEGGVSTFSLARISRPFAVLFPFPHAPPAQLFKVASLGFRDGAVGGEDKLELVVRAVAVGVEPGEGEGRGAVRTGGC